MTAITQEQRSQIINDLLSDLERTRKFILSSESLKSIFNNDFFSIVRNQIEELKENKWGLVHPLWNLMLSHEPSNSFAKLKLLDEYLTSIFSHPATTKANKDYIKKELVSTSKINSLNMLFEISVLGLLLKYFDHGKIVLYIKTVGNKNVEASVVLLGRPVYLETTVIGESEKDQSERIEMTTKGKRTWGGSRDINKDIGRVVSKLKDKAKQMMEGTPNVLLLGAYDFYPDEFHITSALRRNKFSKIGLIMQFGRGKIEKIYKDGLDNNCSLSEDEEKRLSRVFNEKYVSLIYG